MSNKLKIDREQTQWRSSTILRSLPIMLIPIAVAIISLLWLRMRFPAEQFNQQPQRDGTPITAIVVIIMFVSALIIFVRLGRPTISAFALVGFWTLITTSLAVRSGITSFFPALLVLPICAAGLLIDRSASIGLAVLASLLVISLAWAKLQGYDLARQAPPSVFTRYPWLVSTVFWITLFWMVASMTWLLAGNLQRALQQSRAHAQDLEQLRSQLEQRVQAQTAELAQRTHRAEALYNISSALALPADITQILPLIAEQAHQLLHVDYSWIMLNHQCLAAYPEAAVHEPNLQFESASITTVMSISSKFGEHTALVLPFQLENDQVQLILAGTAIAQTNTDDRALAEGLRDQAVLALNNQRLLAQVRDKAMLEERTRLARDIHDTLAQGLTGIVIQLGATQRALVYSPSESSTHLALASRMAREALAEARASVWNLRAPLLDANSLTKAIQELAAHPMRPDLQVDVQIHGQALRLDLHDETALLRITQEALANVVKHSKAEHVSIQLIYGNSSVELLIHDNGTGFDQAILTNQMQMTNHFGLIGMRERVAQIGGSLQLSNQHGALVHVQIPYNPPQTALVEME